MTDISFLQRTLQRPLNELTQLNPEQRGSAFRAAIPDLNYFFDEGKGAAERNAPARTRSLAASLIAFLGSAEADPAHHAPVAGPALAERVVTDAFLRSEADRDQNVYLGKLFTRTLTTALPDVIFQPVSLAEAAAAMRWARRDKVPVTLRGAASTAMGGAVPNDAGLTLDLSRLDHVDLDAAGGVCVLGAGARLRTVHQKLAERGFMLPLYPSNLGGTFAGWFVTGGIGLNAYSHGKAASAVRAADLLLPSGEHLRLHDDGRLDVPDGAKRKTLTADESVAWFRARGHEPISLADLAGSEGVFGLLVQLTVAVEKRTELGAFLLRFESQAQAFEAVTWIGREAGRGFPRPANVKLFSASHMHHTRTVWKDEDAKDWHARPSTLSSGANMPWTRIVGPAELGATTADAPTHHDHAGAYLMVDFFGLDGARSFVAALAGCPGSPATLGDESARFAGDRFKPQQTKRLGPGMLAAEVVLPSAEVPRFLPSAATLASGAGVELDAEVYYLMDGSALVIAGYLTDHRRGSFAIDLLVTPAMLDLAMTRHAGRPYVLGRWQSPYFAKKFGPSADRVRAMRRALDAGEQLNRGVLTGFRLHGVLGALASAGFAPGVTLMRMTTLSPLSFVVRGIRTLCAAFPGPGAGRGEPAQVGARFAVRPAEAPAAATPVVNGASHAQTAAARALNCVNCGECNTVCPIFHESKIRLPQMLTHLGEGVFAGETMPETGSTLLDLCMRCGNCEEVCQAGIPHLPLYEAMQDHSDRARPRDRERHIAILGTLRGSPKYTREFLDIRPGGYIKRAPVALPGVNRFVLLRTENDAGPAASCIHCGACVGVCPTGANHEFEGADPRWITTDQNRCIGCGTCVEVCPANLANGGQTLRVMEAPTRDWFVALDEFEKTVRR